MTREEAIKCIQEEKLRYERAPLVNGCPMWEEWQRAIDICDMALSALRAQQEQESKPLNGWISVKDRLPEKDGQYLIFTTKYFTPDHIDEIDHIDGTEISVYSKRFGFLSKNGLHAKYWCELPQPPKGE